MVDKRETSRWGIEMSNSKGQVLISYGTNVYGDGPQGDVGWFNRAEAEKLIREHNEKISK
jgi:hypothetical protein